MEEFATTTMCKWSKCYWRNSGIFFWSLISSTFMFISSILNVINTHFELAQSLIRLLILKTFSQLFLNHVNVVGVFPDNYWIYMHFSRKKKKKKRREVRRWSYLPTILEVKKRRRPSRHKQLLKAENFDQNVVSKQLPWVCKSEWQQASQQCQGSRHRTLLVLIHISHMYMNTI